ncbi:MAG: BamA/TamA family outer membrane protein, partial [Pseudomonadota bacterium]
VAAEPVMAAVDALRSELLQKGYPFATVGEPDITVDHATRTATLTLDVAPGPRGRFADLIVSGEDSPFTAKHIAGLARFQKGEVYSAEDVEDLRRALIATGLVGNVRIEPINGYGANDTDTDDPENHAGETYGNEPNADGTGENETDVDLAIALTPAPPRTLAAEAAVDTEDGFRVAGSWQHRNFFPPEGALTASLVFGTQQQLASIDVRRSNYGERDQAIGGRVAAFREDRDAFFSRGVAFSGFLERETNLIWQKRWTYRIGPELIFTQERDRGSLVDGKASLETFYIAAFPGQLGYDGTDDLLDPTESFRLAGRLSPEISFEGGTFGYVRAEVAGSTYIPLTESRDTVIAMRGLIASILGADAENIAPSRRLYAGGGSSVRGYGFQEVGPRDADLDPLGGRSAIEGSIEARYRFGNFGAVAFIDAGQVYIGSDPTFEDIRFGAGVGARYYTSFGPIRADIATPIDPRTGDSLVELYVSIGQAF